ncbi:MAG: LacI family DNA-binding transcriptional regulator [Eubacteriales bacterium]|nr:LacI family DNA-binding transcriptional regulator [Eubacteriales bacterium]
MAIGLKELSKELNVSVSTISRVVNGGKNVKPETYQYVMKAIKKYGYVPNEAARNLKSNKSNTIAVVVPDITNPFYSSVCSGVESFAKTSGYSILLCNCSESYEKQLSYTNILLQRNVAGIIISPLGECKPYYNKYKRENIPVMFFDNYPNDLSEYDCVSIDNYSAAYKLAEHMINMYRDDILLLSCPDTESSISERLKAFYDAFSDRGLKFRKDWVYVAGSSSIKDGYDFTQSLLGKGDKPAGILVTTNTTAYGAIAAVTDCGLSVPNDIGVACFDALDPTGLSRPKITSMNQPAMQIGIVAIKTLLGKINDEDNKSIHQKITLEPIFDVRESCGFNLKNSHLKNDESVLHALID